MKKALARHVKAIHFDGPVTLFERAGNEVERHAALALLQGREALRFVRAPHGARSTDCAIAFARDAASHAFDALSIESCDRCLDSLDEIECEGNLCPPCADQAARDYEDARDVEPDDVHGGPGDRL